MWPSLASKNILVSPESPEAKDRGGNGLMLFVSEVTGSSSSGVVLYDGSTSVDPLLMANIPLPSSHDVVESDICSSPISSVYIGLYGGVVSVCVFSVEGFEVMLTSRFSGSPLFEVELPCFAERSMFSLKLQEVFLGV